MCPPPPGTNRVNPKMCLIWTIIPEYIFHFYYMSNFQTESFFEFMKFSAFLVSQTLACTKSETFYENLNLNSRTRTKSYSTSYLKNVFEQEFCGIEHFTSSNFIFEKLLGFREVLSKFSNTITWKGAVFSILTSQSAIFAYSISSCFSNQNSCFLVNV